MKEDFNHHFNRRCKNHDYRSRCIYMITILKATDIPVFSSITQDPEYTKASPIVTLTPLGEIIYECLKLLSREIPQLKIFQKMAMPDHLHFELFVMERTEPVLGSIIGRFKSMCSQRYWQRFPDTEIAHEKRPIFTQGFNDKIAFRAGAKDTFYNYIADNPRRYLVKKLYSHYFYHKMMIEIAGISCGVYGNIFLLDNPVKSFVKISRDKSKMPDLAERLQEWEETIRCGGVLVSPFINPAEKEIRDKGIENGNGLIIVVDYRFSERTKPYKSLFDLCAEGRMLIISTEEEAALPKEMRYSRAQKLNGIARELAALPPRGARFHPRRPRSS